MLVLFHHSFELVDYNKKYYTRLYKNKNIATMTKKNNF